ncbi:MAG: TIGR01212 family radical SAM protein [Nitrospinota bacterium]
MEGALKTGNRYRSLSSYLRERFGERVQKVSIDAGFTCPNRDGTKATGGCTFCNNRGFSPPARVEPREIAQQIRQGVAFLRHRTNARKFLAYFQAFTNTYAPVEVLRERYGVIREFPEVVGLVIGTRPDCVPEETLDLIAEFAEGYHVWVEYGLQSASDRTLEIINRAHPVADFADAVERTHRRAKAGLDLHTCAHVILGLPGETREDMLNTARFVASLPLDGVKIHLLHVLRGTPLEAQYRRGEFRLLEMEEYAGLVCDFLELLPPEMVIQRLTGEAPEEFLVAPRWCLDKNKVFAAIQAKLERRDAYQGKLFPGQ